MYLHYLQLLEWVGTRTHLIPIVCCSLCFLFVPSFLLLLVSFFSPRAAFPNCEASATRFSLSTIHSHCNTVTLWELYIEAYLSVVLCCKCMYTLHHVCRRVYKSWTGGIRSSTVWKSNLSCSRLCSLTTCGRRLCCCCLYGMWANVHQKLEKNPLTECSVC